MRLMVPLVSAGCMMEVPIGTIRDTTPDPLPPPIEDRDEDGVTADNDCDDLDDQVGGKPDVCDGLDNDCDGWVDAYSATSNVCHVEARLEQKMQTDVLIVVDNSSSMQAYYWAIAAEGAYAMGRHLIGPGSDTRIGVITTDMENPDYSGRLVSPSQQQGNPWLDGDSGVSLDGAHDWFVETIADRTDPQIWGAEGVRSATLRATELNDSANHSFFRAGVSLNVIALTNEEDHSSPSTVDFLEAMKSFEQSAEPPKVYAVTQTTGTDCLGRSVEAAASIIAVVQQTGGYYESVCMTDWRGFLSSVGQSIAADALEDTFHLDAPARLGTLSITIQENEFSYPWDAPFALIDAHTLVFPDARPPAGSTIIVDYLEEYRDE